MSDTPKLDIDAIEARAKAATPGPWQCFPHYDAKFHHIKANFIVAPVEAPTGKTDTGYTAEGVPVEEAIFIAHARQDVPALVEEDRMLRAEVEQLKADRGKWRRVADDLRIKGKNLADAHGQIAFNAGGGYVIREQQWLDADEHLSTLRQALRAYDEAVKGES